MLICKDRVIKQSRRVLVLAFAFVVIGCKKPQIQDPITQLEMKFASEEVGMYGFYTPIYLSETASIEELLSDQFKKPYRDQGYITNYTIISDRAINLAPPPSENPAHSYLLHTNLGYQIVVAEYQANQSSWNLKIYPSEKPSK
jgi:hypothetical protein